MKFSELNNLVEENKLDEIKAIVGCSISNKEDRRNMIQAMSAAILQNKNEIIQFFLAQGLEGYELASDSSDVTSLIRYAAEAGNLDLVKRFAERGTRIKPIHIDGDDINFCQAPLYVAIIRGHANVVKFLLKKRAPATIYEEYSKNQIWLSLDTGIFKGCDYGIEITGLMVAAYNQDREIVKLLIRYEAKLKSTIIHMIENINSFSEDVCTRVFSILLDYAPGLDFPETFLNFLKSKIKNISGFNLVGLSINGEPIRPKILKGIQGAKEAIVSITDLNLNKVEESRCNIIKAILDERFKERGKLIDSEGIMNIVPLQGAVIARNKLAVKTRLLAGCNPNEKHQYIYRENHYPDLYPVQIAAANGDLDIIKLLTDASGFDKKTLLSAIDVSKVKKVKKYLKSLLNIDGTDEYGTAQIHKAVANNDFNEVKRLIKKKANLNLTSYIYDTPLIKAIREHNVEMVAILLEMEQIQIYV